MYDKIIKLKKKTLNICFTERMSFKILQQYKILQVFIDTGS